MHPQRPLSKDGSPHVTDEKFNTVSHLLGLFFACIGSAFLLVRASQVSAWHVVGASLYALGLISLFGFSTLHHGLNGGEALERRLRTLDYLAIFLLIAGTFSPFCLTVARNPLGWTVFGGVWGFSFSGILLRGLKPELPKAITMTFYLGLGWIATLLVLDLYRGLGLYGLLGMILGGLFYSVGGVIYILEKPNPLPGSFGFHEIWHLFVIAGALTHYAVLLFCWL
jgi:hemolysin III